MSSNPWITEWRPSNSRPGLRMAVWSQVKGACRRSLRPIGCTPALSVTQKRRCSCGMRLVTLDSCYIPLPLRMLLLWRKCIIMDNPQRRSFPRSVAVLGLSLYSFPHLLTLPSRYGVPTPFTPHSSSVISAAIASLHVYTRHDTDDNKQRFCLSARARHLRNNYIDRPATLSLWFTSDCV